MILKFLNLSMLPLPLFGDGTPNFIGNLSTTGIILNLPNTDTSTIISINPMVKLHRPSLIIAQLNITTHKPNSEMLLPRVARVFTIQKRTTRH